MNEKQQINEIAKIICKSCFDSKDSVFDCNASERPCNGAVDKAELVYNNFFKKALKKFADQVKMRFYYHFDEIMPSIMADEIDKILKEDFGIDTEKIVCPVCGQEMDETYHGRQYCKNCDDKLKGKK